MKMVTIALVCVCFVAITHGNVWTSPFEARSHWSQVRSSRSGEGRGCEVGGGKCYSTAQCCKGFVCAEFDDYVGELSYAVPGFCVREKDLELCAMNDDCPMGTRCILLGRTGNRYCAPLPVPQKPKGKQIYQSGGKGGLGAACSNNSDCKMYTSDGESRLCCQQVKRGRQGWRKMCDRVSEVSRCIVSRK